MANVKISNLTAATTPVAGTEVLPIVQSGATVKVSIANLTAGRSVSATGLALAGSTSGTVTLTAKAVAGSSTFRLPAADGTSGQAMVTDGSGNLSFATASSGDVSGPASATANGIALFNSTTGKLIKDSAASDGLIYGLTVGRGAGAVATNTAVGAYALAANTSGTTSVAVGYNAGTSAVTATENTFVGSLAGQNIIGSGNAAFGSYALNNIGGVAANGTGTYNCAFGKNALLNTTSGGYNVALGPFALQGNTTASNNVGIGYQAGYSNTTGTTNTAIGTGALYTNTTASDSVAVGRFSLYSNNGAQNTSVGTNTMYSNTSGTNNTAVGQAALYSNTTGTGNTCVGQNAGNDAVRTITTNSNEGVFGNNSTAGLYVKVAWTVTSDLRDKTNIGVVPHGLDFVTKLKPIKYQYKVSREDDTPTGHVRYGFGAQNILELEGDTPVIINNDDSDNLKLTDQNLIAVLVNAIKELKAEIDALKGASA